MPEAPEGFDRSLLIGIILVLVGIIVSPAFLFAGGWLSHLVVEILSAGWEAF